MVQREVADRLFASPSTKAYGAVSVLVQLAAERTGFHPVSREVFRPRPNVDSALVAFRRVGLPDRLPGREARRRGRVRAPAQDAPELAPARRPRDPGARRGGARGARPRAVGPRRGARPGGVRRARGGAPVNRAPATAKLNLALVVGPARPDGKHEVATVLQRLALCDRVRVEPAARLSVRGFAEDTLVGDALRRLAAEAGVEPRWAATIDKKLPVAAGLGGGSSDAATALRLANATLRRAAPARAAARPRRRARRRRPVLPRAGPAARHGRRQRALAARAAAGLLGRPALAGRGGEAVDRRGLRRVRRPRRGGGLRGAPRRAASPRSPKRGARATSPRCPATTSPPRRSRPSSRSSAPSAPTSPAPGPVVYGLFLHRDARRRRPPRALRGRGRTWLTVPAWYG